MLACASSQSVRHVTHCQHRDRKWTAICNLIGSGLVSHIAYAHAARGKVLTAIFPIAAGSRVIVRGQMLDASHHIIEDDLGWRVA